MASPLSVLARERDFRRLFLAQLVMFGCDWFVMIPLLVLLPRLTGGGLMGALVLAADTGINAVVLPFAGAVADRVDRRRIVVVANLCAIVAVLSLLAVRSAGSAWLAPVAVGLVAVAKAFSTPAGAAALPNLVPPADLPAANAVIGSAWGTMSVVGASAGGVLSAAFSPYTCFLATACGLAAAAALAGSVRRPMQARAGAAPALDKPLRAILDAVRHIARAPRVLSLVTVKSAVGLSMGVLTLYPLLAAAGGDGAAATSGARTGLLFAARGAGALIGPLLLRGLAARPRLLLPALAASMAAYGVAYLAVAVTPWFALILALVVVAHTAGGANWSLSVTGLQTEAPDALRGRVFAADIMLASLTMSLSQLVIGAFVDRVAVRALVACCGAVTLVYAVLWRLMTLRLGRPARAAEAALDAP